jgi:hypothetical protein
MLLTALQRFDALAEQHPRSGSRDSPIARSPRPSDPAAARARRSDAGSRPLRPPAETNPGRAPAPPCATAPPSSMRPVCSCRPTDAPRAREHLQRPLAVRRSGNTSAVSCSSSCSPSCHSCAYTTPGSAGDQIQDRVISNLWGRLGHPVAQLLAGLRSPAFSRVLGSLPPPLCLPELLDRYHTSVRRCDSAVLAVRVVSG